MPGFDGTGPQGGGPMTGGGRGFCAPGTYARPVTSRVGFPRSVAPAFFGLPRLGLGLMRRIGGRGRRVGGGRGRRW
jgi:hypothetical protein